MKKQFHRMLVLALVCALLLTLCGCSGESGNAADSGPVALSFKQALSYDYLRSLNGKQVTINGYLATSSPVDGSFIFLMNMPFQSCPFCVPNTSQLSNTMEVYPAKGTTFSYTNQAVKVTGRLAVAESADKPFTDLYGYEFAFKIEDASYVILKAEDVSEKMALWQRFAATNIINELYAMYDYVNFLCDWPSYSVNGFTDADGTVYSGYYLYAADAVGYLENDGAQFNYGRKDGYFDDLIAAVRAIDATAFEDLVANIESAKVLSDDAYQELVLGRYTYEEQYVERFENTDYIYTLINGESLVRRMDELYASFSSWLAGWEL